MKNIAANIPGHGFAVVVVLFLVFVLDHSSIFAEPRGGNEARATRPEFIFVSGEVNVAQRYVYTNDLTLAAAIKRANGLTAQALPGKVSLTRIGEKPLTIDYKAIKRGKAKDIALRPGDRIFVPRK
jgi:hypothetical protein